MKKLIATALAMFSFAATATTSVSLNSVDWTDSSPGKDFNYIEVESFKPYEWGSVYGFVDVEKFNKYSSIEDVAISYKVAVTVNQDLGFNDYVQMFTYAEKHFQAMDAVYGKQFTLADSNWHVSPFLGIQYSINNNNFADTYFSGLNGLMLGWNAGYQITEKVSVSNWHEFTFMRDHEYLRNSGDKRDIGINGALAVWYHFTPMISTGIQWRYADNKLGSTHGSNAVIYTVKATF